MYISLLERRRVPRIPFETNMKFKVLKSKSFPENIDFEDGKIINISEYGIGIIINKHLKEEDIMRIAFVIGKMEFNIFCEVIWCKEISFTGTYEAGLEFSYIKDEEYNFLCSAVRTLRNMYMNEKKDIKNQ